MATMNEIEIRGNIEKILEIHRKGLRDIDETTKNLANLFATIPLEIHDKFFNYLFQILVLNLSQGPLPQTSERVRDPSILRVIMRAISEFGPADRAFQSLFGHFFPENQVSAKNWGDDIFPEIVIALYSHPERLSQGTLTTMKAHIAQFSRILDRSHFSDGPIPSHVSGIANLERAIEDIEFRRFERALSREASKTAAGHQHAAGTIDPIEELESYLIGLNLDRSIARAMVEARNYLNTDGEFDPKKAADLIRSSIDQMHRSIVGVLVRVTGKPFTEKDSDGGRRRYLRSVSFITAAEETFFSAVYTLMSQEGTHKLDAPRETVLVMERTISDYLLLLARRLSEPGASGSRPSFGC